MNSLTLVSFLSLLIFSCGKESSSKTSGKDQNNILITNFSETVMSLTITDKDAGNNTTLDLPWGLTKVTCHSERSGCHLKFEWSEEGEKIFSHVENGQSIVILEGNSFSLDP